MWPFHHLFIPTLFLLNCIQIKILTGPDLNVCHSSKAMFRQFDVDLSLNTVRIQFILSVVFIVKICVKYCLSKTKICPFCQNRGEKVKCMFELCIC